ncbi:MAG: hypothetical protein WBP29_11965 [Candidatus Zixiibacteriota bacterium]
MLIPLTIAFNRYRLISKGDHWQWISIPKGESKTYNANPTKEKGPA